MNKKTLKITYLAMMVCSIYVGRLSFTFIPNFQPMTAMLCLIASVFGFRYGLVVSTLSLLMSNINLGMGIWTIPQILSYAFIVALFDNEYLSRDENRIFGAMVCGFSGMAYGFLISFFQIPYLGANIFIPYYLSGLPFDVSHAIGNFVFYLTLQPVMVKILQKAKNRIGD